MSGEKKVTITVLLSAGRLPLGIMEEVHRLAERYSLGVYLSTAQNLRLNDVPEGVVDEVKGRLATRGAEFKGPGKFPIPRVCEGKDYCNLGVVDTADLSKKILDRFAGRKETKAKFKIAISGCTMCCSNVKTTDIGIMGTRDGLELYAGGKGGPFPKIGRRIVKNASEERVLEVIETLVEFHDRKTVKKQRMYKLLADPEFPFVEVATMIDRV
jgi:dissimilatory sulfite reductase (desulfoviridin) alpha/beta subunit